MYNISTVETIYLKDEVIYLDDNDFMKKVYPSHKLHAKVVALTDYYKYHTEIPKIYMKPGDQIVNCKYILFRFP